MKHAYLFNNFLRSYRRSKKKLQRLISEGKNRRKQDILQRRMVRLFKVLTDLQPTFKTGIATIAITASALLFQPDAAQAQLIRFNCPGPIPTGLMDIGFNSTPVLVDLDNDGDLDLMSGEFYGNFFYFKNSGDAQHPVFDAPQTNPFGLTGIGFHSSPSFADLDKDGDLDMISGDRYGNFYYFKDTSTSATPAFDAPVMNPFGLVDIGGYSAPVFTDLDNDGDIDLLVGEQDGNFIFFNDTGTTAIAFDAPNTNPFGLGDIGALSSLALVNLDNDADLDVMAGEGNGDFYYFKNNGSVAVPSFAAVQMNPFKLTAVGSHATVAFADMDADGDMDMIVGKNSGNFTYLQNIGTAAAPVFAAPPFNPFGLTHVGHYSNPAFADIDGDGDLDMISGESDGSFKFFRDTGITAPAFDAVQTNPFGLVSLTTINSSYDYSTLAIADLDGDGDFDIMAGERYGNFIYFKDTSTAATPAFDAPVLNPFGLSSIGSYSHMAFIDLDNDGDLDLMAGESNGNFIYFKNIGNNTSPVFDVPQTNPFGLSDIGNNSAPAFVDLDKDGDMDLIAGGQNGNFFYFRNAGTKSSPAFAPDLINPFGLTNIDYYSSPAFADLDGDGDLDMLTGLQNGDFSYFKNTTTCYGITIFADADGDGFGNVASTLFAADCIIPVGYVSDSTDCNDAATAIHVPLKYYVDNDNDGFGNALDTVMACTLTPPAGAVSDSTDCNDNNIFVNPSVAEIPNNGIDDNCNGQTDEVSGIEEFNTLSSVILFPNPVKDIVTLAFSIRQSLNLSIQVYDMSGRVLKTFFSDNLFHKGEHSIQFDTSPFSNGIYMVKINSSNGMERNVKLIVL